MKRYIVLTFGLLLSSFGFAQTNGINNQYIGNALNAYSDNINAGDARYIGMGGSMGALGGNLSSINQNPAGLGVHVASELSLTLGVRSYENQTRFGNTGLTDDSTFDLANAGAALVFPGSNLFKSFTLGVNFATEDLDNELFIPRNENIGFIDDSDPTNVQSFTFDGYGDNLRGFRTKFNLGFGANYQDKIYLGTSLNFHSTQLDGSILYRETNDADGTATIYDQASTPYFERGDGFSFSLGAIAKLNQNLRLGAAVHSPVWYTNIQEEFLAFDDQGFFTALSDYDLSTGWRFVGSGGLVVGKNLALNADYILTVNDETFRPRSNFTNENQFVDDFVGTTSELRLGGEFRVKDLRLRAGYGYVTSPVDDFNFTGGFVNGQGQVSNANVVDAFVGDMQRYSLGIGYNFKGFYIDAAYQNQNQEYSYLFGANEFLDASGNSLTLSDPYVANVDASRNQYLLTFGWKF